MSPVLIASEVRPKAPECSAFLYDMMTGLANLPRSVPPKHFYDAAGSALFDRICELPEYYLTRTELGILHKHAREMAAQIGPQAEIVEFGAGSLTKIRILFDAFEAADAPRKFLPIDISGEHMNQAARTLQAHYPRLAVQPIVADYTEPMLLPAPAASGQRVGFFPGSTIGNFEPEDALAFLQQAAQLLRGGGLLIGVDLQKAPEVLHAAYNDAQGVTAAFNLNLLRRANAELAADFDLDAFAHYAFFNPVRHRIEMHLISQRRQTVHVGGETFHLEEGASIHTESSYKYTVEGFRLLASKAGFVPGHVWTDEQRYFSVHWLASPAA
ncbi:MAG: L-histidine N(alpha)-methyltransferase [Burkholderiales bacterium]|nr:L-histidine N(alpha)-methyltransferase [Burkholderiales bacterium]